MANNTHPRTKNCAQCRLGENEVEADGLYVGNIYDDSGRLRPYRAWLCDDHLTMLCDDGGTLRKERSA